MSELERIKKYVARHIQLTEDEENYFISLVRINNVKKKQLIVQPEFVCKYRSYVYKGAMRSYLLDNDGQEHTIALAIEDWWIADYNSFIFQRPATLFVEALEDSTLIQIDYNAEQLLMEAFPKFERFYRIITQRSFAFLQQRLLSNLSKSAEDRYEEFLKKYPKVVQKVPQYVLASYLGMSPVYLSQLRNNRANKKS
ncbi:MAG TPA: Crp/Fnr family transcriptional regulator [Candidatus Kapabacteria bacterium]|nr:Crp/Fnr family transcriptional regulator [Candidatus Kapabacteria bacterium]